MSLTVSRKRLLDSPDINLTGDRYRTAAVRPNGKWPMVPIGEICELQNGRAFKPTDWEKKEANGLAIIRIQNLNDPQAEFNYYSGEVDERLIVHRGDLLFSWSGSRGTSFGPHIWDRSDGILNQHIFNVRHKETVNRQFFYWMLKKAVEQVEENLHGGVGLVHITKGNLERIEIPVLPIDEQEQIVAELEGYRKVIEGARQILTSYKPTIRIDPKWPTDTLSNVCDSVTDGDHQPPPKSSSGVPFVTITNINDQHQIDFAKTFFVPHSYYENLSELRKPRRGDILYTVTGSYGIPVPIETDLHFCFQRHIGLIRPSKKWEPRFLACVLASPHVMMQADKAATGAAQKTVSLNSLRNFIVPIPPLDIQRQIVAELEAEQKLVEANRELIARMEAKIKAKLAEVWGEEGLTE